MDKPTESLSILDKDLKAEGTLHVEGKLVIVGSMEGTLLGNKVVTAPGSHVVGQAMVKEMVIGGDFQGDVTAYQCVEIAQTGTFQGSIVCKDLKVQPGGQLNGNVRPLEVQEEAPAPAAPVSKP